MELQRSSPSVAGFVKTPLVTAKCIKINMQHVCATPPPPPPQLSHPVAPASASYLAARMTRYIIQLKKTTTNGEPRHLAYSHATSGPIPRDVGDAQSRGRRIDGNNYRVSSGLQSLNRGDNLYRPTKQDGRFTSRTWQAY